MQANCGNCWIIWSESRLSTNRYSLLPEGFYLKGFACAFFNFRALESSFYSKADILKRGLSALAYWPGKFTKSWLTKLLKSLLIMPRPSLEYHRVKLIPRYRAHRFVFDRYYLHSSEIVITRSLSPPITSTFSPLPWSQAVWHRIGYNNWETSKWSSPKAKSVMVSTSPWNGWPKPLEQVIAVIPG